MVSSFRRARSAATDTNDDSYRFLNVFGGGDSHGSPEPERVSAGNKDLTKYMPRVTFVKLARRQRFTEILEILRREDEYDIDGWFFLEAPKTRFMFSLTAEGGDSSSQNLHSFRGESPLHIILHYHPNRTVVDKLIRYLSSSKKSHTVPEDAIDIQGFTPLHVGASKGCSASVMERLLNGVSAVMPAVTKDSMGRHALHWACENPSFEARHFSCVSILQGHALKKSNGDLSAVDNIMIQVIFLLIKAYPEASTIPDMEGNTPLDLAIENEVDPRIISLLEGAIQNCKQARAARVSGNKQKRRYVHNHCKGGDGKHDVIRRRGSSRSIRTRF
jgi:hypothetical protein